jgi:hypothetical protein
VFNLNFKITFDEEIAKSKLRNRSLARLREAGRFFREQIEANAPVDTGKMKASVKLVPNGNGLILFVDVNYAMFVEFGFTHYLSGKWIPPNPFIRRAAAATYAKYPFLFIEVKPRGRGRRAA